MCIQRYINMIYSVYLFLQNLTNYIKCIQTYFQTFKTHEFNNFLMHVYLLSPNKSYFETYQKKKIKTMYYSIFYVGWNYLYLKCFVLITRSHLYFIISSVLPDSSATQESSTSVYIYIYVYLYSYISKVYWLLAAR